MDSSKTEMQSPPINSNTTNNLSVLPDFIGPAMPIIKEIYSDAASPGAKKVGMALETVLDFGYTFLLMPLQHASDKKKLNFKKNMEMYKKETEFIEEKDIAEVPTELGIPIIQNLTYIQNDELAELFTTLLTCASSLKTCSLAHPGFIKIIESLSVDEAKILKYFSENNITDIPFISARGLTEEGYIELSSRLTGYEKKEGLGLLFPDNDHLYFENMENLGLLEAKDATLVVYADVYNDLEALYDQEIKNYLNSLSTESPLTPNFKKGTYKLTFYGSQFLKACIKK